MGEGIVQSVEEGIANLTKFDHTPEFMIFFWLFPMEFQHVPKVLNVFPCMFPIAPHLYVLYVLPNVLSSSNHGPILGLIIFHGDIA
jgi:hypothetical protein